jgi:uncharacterized paraquat-inducible protein A
VAQAMRFAREGITSSVLSTIAVSGDQAIAFVILGSIVIPLAALGWLCWFFWKHRHDE